MKYTIQRVTETENGESVQEIACLEREIPEIPGIESVGITLAEAKTLLLGIQQALVGHQVSAYLERHRNCQDCGKALLSKGDHTLLFRTLFGNIGIEAHGCPTIRASRTKRRASARSPNCSMRTPRPSAFIWRPNGPRRFPSTWRRSSWPTCCPLTRRSMPPAFATTSI